MTRVVEENVARWLATGAFVACAGGLMWALGSSLGLWAGLGFGAIVSGLIGGRLWATHLDNVAIERDKAHNVGRRFEPAVDEAQQPGRPHLVGGDAKPPGRLRSADYYDDEDD